MSIQLSVLNKCSSVSSPCLPANSGFKCNQFSGGTGPGYARDTVGTTGCPGSVACGTPSSSCVEDTTSGAGGYQLNFFSE